MIYDFQFKRILRIHGNYWSASMTILIHITCLIVFCSEHSLFGKVQAFRLFRLVCYIRFPQPIDQALPRRLWIHDHNTKWLCNVKSQPHHSAHLTSLRCSFWHFKEESTTTKHSFWRADLCSNFNTNRVNQFHSWISFQISFFFFSEYDCKVRQKSRKNHNPISLTLIIYCTFKWQLRKAVASQLPVFDRLSVALSLR